MPAVHKHMESYTIKQVSQMFHLPASTLRYYEDMGILTNIERSESGQRIYEQKHINRLRTIFCFKRTGMSIAQLQEFFSYEGDESAHIDDILHLLEKQKAHVAEQIAKMQQDLKHVERKLRYYGDIKTALDAGTELPHWTDYSEKEF